MKNYPRPDSFTNTLSLAFAWYDSSGNRVRKIAHKAGAITEEKIYNGNYELYRKKVGGTLNTERETTFVSDDQKRIAIVDTRNLPTPAEVTIRFQYDNHLGSACLELDGSGDVISYEEYHPFGTTSYRAGRNATETSLKRYKYVGKERDEETGLYYYGARYYAAWLCRFVSVDPLQFKYPHYTSYQYAGNKPISFIDLDGLEEKKQDPFMNYIMNKMASEVESVHTTTDNAKPSNLSPEIQEALLSRIPENKSAIEQLEIRDRAQNINNIQRELEKSQIYQEIKREQDNSTSEIVNILDQKGNLQPIENPNCSKGLGTPLVDPIDIGAGLFIGAFMLSSKLFGSSLIKSTEKNILFKPLSINSTIGNKSLLTSSEILRIGNAATRIGKPINVIGSRATGKSTFNSDWDYVIQGLTNKEWKKIKNSIPGAPSKVNEISRNMKV